VGKIKPPKVNVSVPNHFTYAPGAGPISIIPEGASAVISVNGSDDMDRVAKSYGLEETDLAAIIVAQQKAIEMLMSHMIDSMEKKDESI